MQATTHETLARRVRGTVLDGQDPQAAAEVAAFNRAVTHHPAVVVAARDADDVAEAVRYAAAQGLPVAVQATGHGASRPVDAGLLVTTRAMQGVHIDPVARRARVEAGVRWRSVIDAAAPHGLAPLSGSSSGVGVVGYTTGGGMGHLARRHGFAADLVRSVDLVTADGARRTVTPDSDPDLFWAVRGGQSAFGLVTALEFDLVPVPEFTGGAMIFSADDAPRVLHAWSAWAPTLPEEVTTSVAILRLPAVPKVPAPLRGVVSLAVRFAHHGPAERVAGLVAPMRRVATPVLDSIGPMPYAAVDAIHMDPTDPMPAVARGGLLGSLPEAAVETLLTVAGPGVDVPLAVVELRLMGGALGRPAPVPNAVAGREGAFSVSVVAPAPPPLAEVAPALAGGVVEALAPWSTGTTLVNFGGDRSTLARAWAPDVLTRLRAVKAAVDPGDVFGGPLGTPDAVPAAVTPLVPAGAR